MEKLIKQFFITTESEEKIDKLSIKDILRQARFVVSTLMKF